MSKLLQNQFYLNLNGFIRYWETLTKDEDLFEELLFSFNFRNLIHAFSSVLTEKQKKNFCNEFQENIRRADLYIE